MVALPTLKQVWYKKHAATDIFIVGYFTYVKDMIDYFGLGFSYYGMAFFTRQTV